jgi:hypothetical protein
MRYEVAGDPGRTEQITRNQWLATETLADAGRSPSMGYDLGCKHFSGAATTAGIGAAHPARIVIRLSGGATAAIDLERRLP